MDTHGRCRCWTVRHTAVGRRGCGQKPATGTKLPTLGSRRSSAAQACQTAKPRMGVHNVLLDLPAQRASAESLVRLVPRVTPPFVERRQRVDTHAICITIHRQPINRTRTSTSTCSAGVWKKIRQIRMEVLRTKRNVLLGMRGAWAHHSHMLKVCRTCVSYVLMSSICPIGIVFQRLFVAAYCCPSLFRCDFSSAREGRQWVRCMLSHDSMCKLSLCNVLHSPIVRRSNMCTEAIGVQNRAYVTFLCRNQTLSGSFIFLQGSCQ